MVVANNCRETGSLARWHCLNSHNTPSGPLIRTLFQLFMATLIAAIEVPWLGGTHIFGVFSDITNNYAHGGCGSGDLDNKVLNSAPSANLVGPSSSRRRKEQPAKRPRMNPDNAGNSAKTGLSRRVRGRLSELPTMPLDILFEVCDIRCLMMLTLLDKHDHFSDFWSSPPFRLAHAHSREQGFSFYAPIPQLFIFVEQMLQVL